MIYTALIILMKDFVWGQDDVYAITVKSSRNSLLLQPIVLLLICETGERESKDFLVLAHLR